MVGRFWGSDPFAGSPATRHRLIDPIGIATSETCSQQAVSGELVRLVGRLSKLTATVKITGPL